MMLNKFFGVISIWLCLSACNASTASNANNSISDKQTTVAAPRAIENAPRNEKTHEAKQASQQAASETSDCTKTATGSNQVFKLPSRLCSNNKVPVDESETLPDRRKPTDNPNIYAEEEVKYNKLPAEVREVIQLTAGEQYKNCLFHLYVLRQGDNVGNRIVKRYQYMLQECPNSKTETNDWLFSKQGGNLRLDELQLSN